MKNATIHQTVRRAFTAAGELAKSAQLIRKTADDYMPGSEKTESLSPYEVRFLATEKPLSARYNATDPLIDASLRYGLLECADVVPRIDDDLQIDSVLFTLVQVVPADLGAGILYEVMYR
jgi:hypothetical protein